MEWLTGIWPSLVVETYVLGISLGGLAVWATIVLLERRRGTPFLTGIQDTLGRVLRAESARVRNGYQQLLSSLEHMPRRILAHTVHASASAALSFVHFLERHLKKVLDAVRGKKEVRTGGPPSSMYFSEILPRHRKRTLQSAEAGSTHESQ